MRYDHPVWLLIPAITACLAAYFLSRRHAFADLQGRFAAIDGLRGLLALFVFLHHAACWFEYAKSGQWTDELLPALQVHLGQSSVRLFFMITAFLFTTKILDSKERPIDWIKLYTGRVLRLVPAYALAMLLLVMIVWIRSGWQLNMPAADVLQQLGQWSLFTFFDAPDINLYKDTKLLVAGVSWTLAYEWAFYLALPLLARILMRRAPWPAVLGSAGFVLICAILAPRYLVASSFVGGIVAAFLVRNVRLRSFLAARWMGAGVLSALVLLVTLFDSPWSMAPAVLISVAFIPMAAGCTIFGALDTRTARFLGDVSYSVYLFHGLMLFLCVTMAKPVLDRFGFQPAAYWILQGAIAPLVVYWAALMYRYIERPCMMKTQSVSGFLRQRMA